MNSIGISARSDWIYVLVSMAKTKLEQLQKLAVSLKQQKKEKDEERMRKAKNVEKNDDVPDDGGAEPHAPRAMKRLKPAVEGFVPTESAPAEPAALEEPEQKKKRHRQKTPDPAAAAPSTPPRKTSRGLKRSPEPAREPEADASMPPPRRPARTNKPKVEEPPADVCGLPKAPTFPVTWDNFEKLMDFYKISEADATAVLLLCGPNESAQQFWTKFKKDKGEPAAPAAPAEPGQPSAPVAKPSAPAARPAKPSAPAVAAEPAKPSAPAARPAKPSAPAAKPAAPAAPPAVPEKPNRRSNGSKGKGTLPYKNREEWINTLDSQPRSDDEEDDEWFPEYDLGDGVDGEPLTEEDDEDDDEVCESTTSSDAPDPPPPGSVAVRTNDGVKVIDEMETLPMAEPVLEVVPDPKDEDDVVKVKKELEAQIKQQASPMKSKKVGRGIFPVHMYITTLHVPYVFYTCRLYSFNDIVHSKNVFIFVISVMFGHPIPA
jgi:hypothetical protein